MQMAIASLHVWIVANSGCFVKRKLHLILIAPLGLAEKWCVGFCNLLVASGL